MFLRFNGSHNKSEKYSKFDVKKSEPDIKTSFKETVTEIIQNPINISNVRNFKEKPQNSNKTVVTKNYENFDKTLNVDEVTDILKNFYFTTPFKEYSTAKPKNYKKYRIDTKGCKISDWPLFDEETKRLYKNLTNQKLNCESRRPIINVKRVNSTWIQLDWSKLNNRPYCYISELIRGEGENSVQFGK